MTTAGFLSDNAAPVHPAVMDAVVEANRGVAAGYGQDPWTQRLILRFRTIFGPSAEVLPVFGGTAANVLALRPWVDSHQAVICADSSHLWRDECGAPERFLGAKLVPIPTLDGKLDPARLAGVLHDHGIVHRSQPRAISVAQPTEWGTLYSVDELGALAAFAHAHGMILHVDGARLANAAAALDVDLGALGLEAGVDALSFGGTKLGALGAEAVVLFDTDAAERARYHRKQAMQLASKMRFVAVQLDRLLEGDLWRELALQANAMAARLARELAQVPGVVIAQRVQTNAVFVRLPAPILKALEGHFVSWDPPRRIARFMTAWNTRPGDVERLVERARSALSAR